MFNQTKKLICFLFVILALLIPNYIVAKNNLLPIPLESNKIPNLGSVANSFSTQKKNELAKQVRIILHQNTKQIYHAETYSYLAGIVEKISQQLPVSFDTKVVIIEDSDINAFATFGNVVGINSGLILNSKSEDELASVIAHEIAHLYLKHLERRQLETSTSTVPTIALIAALIFAGNSDLAFAGVNVVIAKSQENNLAYSRLLEKEADFYGLKLLTAAGYNPIGSVNFIQQLQQNNDISAYNYLSTHPITQARAASLGDRITTIQNSVTNEPRLRTKTLKIIQQSLKNYIAKEKDVFLAESTSSEDSIIQNAPTDSEAKIGTYYYLYDQLTRNAVTTADQWQELLKFFPFNVALNISYSQWLTINGYRKEAAENLLVLALKIPHNTLILKELIKVSQDSNSNIHKFAYGRLLIEQGNDEAGCFVINSAQLDNNYLISSENNLLINQTIIELKQYCQ